MRIAVVRPPIRLSQTWSAASWLRARGVLEQRELARASAASRCLCADHAVNSELGWGGRGPSPPAGKTSRKLAAKDHLEADSKPTLPSRRRESVSKRSRKDGLLYSETGEPFHGGHTDLEHQAS